MKLKMKNQYISVFQIGYHQITSQKHKEITKEDN